MPRFVAYACLLAALFALTSATTSFAPGDESKVVLVSFGDADASVTVLHSGAGGPASVSSNPLFTTASPVITEGSNGVTNYSIPLLFNGNVGTAEYTITIAGESVSASVVAAGFVILNADNAVASGESAPGITVAAFASSTYSVRAVGVDGRSVDISATSIRPRSVSGTYYKQVDESATSISSSTFTLALNMYRVGTGKFIVSFDSPAITLNGESFETILTVTQTSTNVPCVAMAASITASSGMVRVPMYNLLAPPQSQNVQKVVLTIASSTYTWDMTLSSLSAPDQVAVFTSVSASGKASITCDGAAAAIMGGDLDITGSASPGTSKAVALADELITSLPKTAGQDEFTAQIRLIDYSPATFTAVDAGKMLDIFCKLVQLVSPSASCFVTGVRAGSVILDVAANIESGTGAKIQTALEEQFASCTIQEAFGYSKARNECDKIELHGKSINKAVGGNVAAAAGGGGLATWTIVLIAVVGAFALMLVIVLGLWAVYRRSSEQSEADYSSSGPLGVPDPSDLLYEQSIVRDIYGRGGFPDGGPSAAVAEERAKEAALREECPRPPSSSGLSRGAGTDDASSTYSV